MLSGSTPERDCTTVKFIFLHRIQNRIIFFFVFLIIVILLVSGWFLHWMIRQSLETELGRKLIAVANAGSVQFSEEEIGFLMQGRFPRVQQRLREQCIELKNATEVERIVFFDNNGNCLLDTEEISGEGKPYFRLRFYPRELDEVRS